MPDPTDESVPSRELTTRGPDGLLPTQREYLQKYAEIGSEAEARQELQITNRRVARWHREDPAFRDAYANLVEGVHEAITQQLKALEEELPESIRRLLKTQKPMEITCPFNKDHKFKITVDHPVVQARMVEMLMKSQGHLIERRRIEGDITLSEGLNVSLRIALALHNDGKEISEQSRRELMTLGLIESDHNTVEGTARALE